MKTMTRQRMEELLKDPAKVTDEDKDALRYLLQSYESLRAQGRPYTTAVKLSPYMRSLLQITGVMDEYLIEKRKNSHGNRNDRDSHRSQAGEDAQAHKAPGRPHGR